MPVTGISSQIEAKGAPEAAAAIDKVARAYTGLDKALEQTTKDAGTASRAVDELGKSQEKASKSGGLGSFLSGAAGGAAFAAVSTGLSAVSAGFAKLGDSVIGTNARLEQARVAFTGMLGSAQVADSFLRQLGDFAAKTPFEFPELVTASQRMLGMGFAARDVIPLLTAVGNAASAMGAGQEGIDRITLALGQMQAKTKVSGDEMLQLTEVGIPAWQMLADAMGEPIPVVQKLAEQGKISSDVFIKAFKDFSDLNWGGEMEKQSHTFEGALSTIRDSLNMTLANAFRPFFATLSAGADRVAQFLSSADFSAWAGRVAHGFDAMTKAIGEDLAGMATDTTGMANALSWLGERFVDFLVGADFAVRSVGVVLQHGGEQFDAFSQMATAELMLVADAFDFLWRAAAAAMGAVGDLFAVAGRDMEAFGTIVDQRLKDLMGGFEVLGRVIDRVIHGDVIGARQAIEDWLRGASERADATRAAWDQLAASGVQAGDAFDIAGARMRAASDRLAANEGRNTLAVAENYTRLMAAWDRMVDGFGEAAAAAHRDTQGFREDFAAVNTAVDFTAAKVKDHLADGGTVPEATKDSAKAMDDLAEKSQRDAKAIGDAVDQMAKATDAAHEDYNRQRDMLVRQLSLRLPPAQYQGVIDAISELDRRENARLYGPMYPTAGGAPSTPVDVPPAPGMIRFEDGSWGYPDPARQADFAMRRQAARQAGLPVPNFDAGGLLTEPVLGRGLLSGAAYGFALRGPESFGGVARPYAPAPPTIQVVIAGPVYGADARALADALTPAIRDNLNRIGIANGRGAVY